MSSPAFARSQPSGADALARALGVTADAADHFARDRAVYSFRGEPFVLYRVRDDLLGRPRAYLPTLAPALVRDGDVMRELLAALLRESTAFEVVLRRPADAEWPAVPELRLSARHFELPLPHTASAPAALVRDARPEDAPFVQDLLTQAVTAGLAQLPPRPRPAAATVARFVHDELGPGGSCGARALLAERDGERVGHLTWLPPARDELTGEPFVEIVDASVVEAHRRARVTSTLVAELAARVRSNCTALRGKVANVPDGSDRRIASGLVADGWVEIYELWHGFRS